MAGSPDDDVEKLRQSLNTLPQPWMRPRRERIPRNHFVVDTSQDITAAIVKIVRATKG